MFGFLKFWGKKKVPVAVKTAPELKKKQLVPDRRISAQEAMAIVMKKYPAAEMNELGRDKSSLWTIKAAAGMNEFLCGWELTQDVAWIEAAKRILGMSRFAKSY